MDATHVTDLHAGETVPPAGQAAQSFQKRLALDRLAGRGRFANEAGVQIEDLFDDADKLFTRLDGIATPPSYHLLGHLGRGVVMALRNRPEESNDLFAHVYGLRRFVNQTPAQLLNRKQDVAVQLLQNPQWRYWMNKALYYNSRNGLPEEKVPPGLQKLLPVKK